MMFGFGAKKQDLVSPFAGEVVGIDRVPDAVFAQRMLGDGFAVIPDADQASIEVCAPASGELVQVFGTRHAFAIRADSGLEILVHIGLDTVELAGEGFTALVEAGSSVFAGQPVILVDLDAVRASGRNPITPVVCTEPDQVRELRASTGPAASGAKVCQVTLV